MPGSIMDYQNIRHHYEEGMVTVRETCIMVAVHGITEKPHIQQHKNSH